MNEIKILDKRNAFAVKSICFCVSVCLTSWEYVSRNTSELLCRNIGNMSKAFFEDFQKNSEYFIYIFSFSMPNKDLKRVLVEATILYL
jgi:hypothetical protein